MKIQNIDMYFILVSRDKISMIIVNECFPTFSESVILSQFINFDPNFDIRQIFKPEYMLGPESSRQ
jgi:hypothetical protein